MKLTYAADIHLRPTTPVSRKDDYVETQFRKLVQLINHSNAIGSRLLIGGDLLDKPTVPYWFLNRLIDTLRHHHREIYVIPGNHCLKGHNLEMINEGSLKTLAEAGVIELLIDSESVDLGLDTWLWPFPFGVEPAIMNPFGSYNILMWHHPIYESSVPFYMKDALTIDELEHKYPGYDLYLVGDIHIPAVRSRTIISGSMMRSTIAQKDLHPRFYEIDTEAGTVDPIYFDIEQDVWKDIAEVVADDSYRARLADLTDALKGRAQRPDFAGVCSQLAGGNPKYTATIQSLIDKYKEQL